MPYRQYSIGHVLYSEHYNFPVYIKTYLIVCVLMYMFVMYCGLHVHTAYIFIC